MNKLTETVFGLFGMAHIGATVWLGFLEGFVPALVFFLFGAVFLGGIAAIAEKIGNALEKVFRPPAT